MMKSRSDILDLMMEDARLCNEAARRSQGIRGLETRQAGAPLTIVRSEPASGHRTTPLSDQEKKDIAHFIAQGWATKQIAVAVGVSKATVTRYRNLLK